MHIRCERCATLYELDDSLLAPEGSPVQCAKCDHVFTASPPRAAEARPEQRAEVRAESRAETRGESRTEAPVEDAPRAPPSSPVSNGVSAGGGGSRALADWDSAPPVYRGSPPVGLRAPLLRQNPVGAFESRLRWMARARWLVPTVAVALIAVVGAGFWVIRGRMHAAAEGTRAERTASSRHETGHRPSPVPPSASPTSAGPDVAPPSAVPAGNEEPSPGKAVALHAEPSVSPSSAPGHPAAGDAPAPAADGATSAAPAGSSAAATPKRRRSAGPLAPAALPELAPASAAPEIEPPTLEGRTVEPRTESAVHMDEPVGGG